MKSNPVLLIAAALAVSLSSCAREEAAAPAEGAEPAIAAHPVEVVSKSPEERMASGKKLYNAHCAACHQANGQGLTGAFPPLAQSTYLADGPGAAISAILNGLSGPISVNGTEYNAVMPNLSYLNDDEVAEIVAFVMNSWGNPGGEASPAEVAAARGD